MPSLLISRLASSTRASYPYPGASVVGFGTAGGRALRGVLRSAIVCCSTCHPRGARRERGSPVSCCSRCSTVPRGTVALALMRAHSGGPGAVECSVFDNVGGDHSLLE